MKRIVKITTLLVAISAFWISLLQTSLVPRTYTWSLPLYFVLSLGCYGLLMVGVGLMQFRTCPQEAVCCSRHLVIAMVIFLYCGGQVFCMFTDIVEAKGFLEQRGVHISS